MDLNYNTTHLNCAVATAKKIAFFRLCFLNVPTTPKVIAASLPVDGAAFSAVPCQKWTHSRADLLSSTPGEAHRGRRTRRALAVLTEAACVRGISLDRLPPPSFVARAGPRVMRGNAWVHMQVRGVAVSPPSLGWQFVSTWRWFTQTARCIADLPGWRMFGWSGLESCGV